MDIFLDIQCHPIKCLPLIFWNKSLPLLLYFLWSHHHLKDFNIFKVSLFIIYNVKFYKNWIHTSLFCCFLAWFWLMIFSIIVWLFSMKIILADITINPKLKMKILIINIQKLDLKILTLFTTAYPFTLFKGGGRGWNPPPS